MLMGKVLICSLLLVMVLTLAAMADEPQTPSSQVYYGDVTETAILWFAGTSVTTEIHGDFALSGSLTIEDEAIPFATCGEINGFGEGDTATFTGVMWAIFTAAGTLGNGEEVEIRGGLIVDGGDFLLATEAAGEGTGTFYMMILLTDARIEVAGTVYGSASGSFVPPDDPYTMQLDVSGTMRFEATSTMHSLSNIPIDLGTLQERLPWDLDMWPEDLFSRLLLLLGESPTP